MSNLLVSTFSSFLNHSAKLLFVFLPGTSICPIKCHWPIIFQLHRLQYSFSFSSAVLLLFLLCLEKFAVVQVFRYSRISIGNRLLFSIVSLFIQHADSDWSIYWRDIHVS